MIPAGAIIIVVSIVVRALSSSSSASAASPTTRRTWAGRSGRCLVAWLVAGPVWLVCGMATLRGFFHPVAVAMLLVSTLLLYPWPLARHITIPLRLTRLTFWLTRLADWTWGRDPVGGAAFAAVLAAGRPSSSTPLAAGWQRLVHRAGDLSWARDRVQRLDLLGFAGVAAAVFLADADGDPVRGDQLARGLDTFDPEVVPRTARRLIQERQAWRIVSNSHLPVDHRRQQLLALDSAGAATVDFLQAVAALDASADAPRWTARARCIWHWLRAPRRRRTWPLLRGRTRLFEVVMTPAAATAPPAADALAIDTENPLATFAAAAAAHADLAAADVVVVADVIAVAARWQRGLVPTQAQTRRRALALGLAGDAAAADLERTVQDSLVQLVERTSWAAVDVKRLPPVLQAAIAEVRSARMDALEIAVTSWRLRLESASDRAPVDELGEWCALRALMDAVASTGDDGAYVAWEASQWVVCELAVRLWNVRREHRLANAMFRWLHQVALAIGDVRSVETQAANVACGP